MAKNILDAKQLAILVGVVVVVSLVVSFIGSSLGNVMTGKVTLSNNKAGIGTYLIRPEGTSADTWLPFSDGSIYLTSNGLKKDAGFVLRKWIGGSGVNAYQNLMTIEKNGNVNINGNLTADNIYTKKEILVLYSMLIKVHDTLNQDEEQIYLPSGGGVYTVKPLYIDTSQAKLSINGESTNTLSPGQSQIMSDGTRVGIIDVSYQGFAGGVMTVEFVIV